MADREGNLNKFGRGQIFQRHLIELTQFFLWLVSFTVRNSVDVDSSGGNVRANQKSHFLSLEIKEKQGSQCSCQ